MDGFLRVDNANLPSSPTNSFLADEVASICPLITPSPPTNDLIHPLPELESNFSIGLELANKLHKVKGDGASDEDKVESASSSSSALAESQLLNHRNIYHVHDDKDEEKEEREDLGKSQTLQLTFRNPPDNYFFMSWNWPLIRKISTWIFLSGLVAMVALVIAMISTLPKTCNPPTFWYQGNLLYEIFPASFYGGKKNMEGDFKGIALKADYLTYLGVRGVRLNSIFNNPNYPDDFDNVTSLIDIAPVLGNLSEFNIMVKLLKAKNISVILDLPLYPYIKRLIHKPPKSRKNETFSGSTIEFLRKERSEDLDVIEDAILHWITNGVEGFYLKGLEKLQDDPNLVESIQRWKQILGEDRVLIVNNNFISSMKAPQLNFILNNVDLVDIKLDLSDGANSVNKQIRSIQNGTLFSKASMPWIQWSLADVYSSRISNSLPYGNGTLGATLLQLMLPGTPSIFYGDEIGLQDISDPNGERQDIKHLHQLTMMPWQNEKLTVIPWIHGDDQVIGRYDQTKLINKTMNVRMKSPSIYMNSIKKEDANKANIEIKYSKDNLLVLQRWYPRRKAYVLVSNLGDKKLSTDLSTLLYSGEIVVGPRTDSKLGSIVFTNVSLWPGESVIAELY
ncbi:4F2 cell-surface antigen heavy chain-like [Diorhabda sublineata]|uniref:4F2 cell-surface antigen heavy chain-like n=1 Tax=Diorhabda sublineata TaxID=1163346 RepID=UPI0024E0EC39|nr:4F2 cell-surface antigen heavy chain-like [Diorhabda sublineata]XP_056646955.1 4F2 cell-surface antigen heavy chain-like [Diorhabda sublineata]